MRLPPSAANTWHQDHVARVVAAFGRVTGGDLVAEAGLDPAALGRSVWEGNFALLTHTPSAILNYANRFALDLWEMDWETMLNTPSRDTAPEEDRAARAAILEEVARTGFTRAYSGRRVSRSGKF